MDPGVVAEPSGKAKFLDFLQEVKIELVGAKEEFEVRTHERLMGVANLCIRACIERLGGGAVHNLACPPHTHQKKTKPGADAQRREAVDEGDGPPGRREGLLCAGLL